MRKYVRETTEICIQNQMVCFLEKLCRCILVLSSHTFSLEFAWANWLIHFGCLYIRLVALRWNIYVNGSKMFTGCTKKNDQVKTPHTPKLILKLEVPDTSVYAREWVCVCVCVCVAGAQTCEYWSSTDLDWYCPLYDQISIHVLSLNNLIPNMFTELPFLNFKILSNLFRALRFRMQMKVRHETLCHCYVTEPIPQTEPSIA